MCECTGILSGDGKAQGIQRRAKHAQVLQLRSVCAVGSDITQGLADLVDLEICQVPVAGLPCKPQLGMVYLDRFHEFTQAGPVRAAQLCLQTINSGLQFGHVPGRPVASREQEECRDEYNEFHALHGCCLELSFKAFDRVAYKARARYCRCGRPRWLKHAKAVRNGAKVLCIDGAQGGAITRSPSASRQGLLSSIKVSRMGP